jgi:hypothetical protein
VSSFCASKSLMAFHQFPSVCCIRLSGYFRTLHKVLHASFDPVNPIFIFSLRIFPCLVLSIHHSRFNPQVFLSLITQSSLTTAFSYLTISPEELVISPFVGSFVNFTFFLRSRDSAVGRATGYGLDDRRVGVRVPVESRIFSYPRRPDRLWGPSSLLSNGYRGLFPRG